MSFKGSNTEAKLELSIGQMELALLRARLDAFTQRFYRKAGSMYVKFDETRTEAARLRARFVPSAQRECQAAGTQWKLSVEDYQRALHRPPPDPARLRRLHVELARIFHPDLALDPVRRSLGAELMTEVNIAVQDGDFPRLEGIRETIQGNADAAAEMAALTNTIPFQLNERNQYALRQQQDLLSDLTGWLYTQAGQAQRNASHTRPARAFPDLMERALEDLRAISVRLFRFPADRSMGELSVRAERNIDSPVTVLGEAKGPVRVPFARAAILRIGKGCTSLEPLRHLDPEDLNGLIDEWPDFVDLTDEMLLPLARFTRLEELHLGRTSITGKAFDRFPRLRELRTLILDETRFDDHGMQRLDESAWMQRLDLSSTQVTRQGLRAIHRMKSLRDLSLYGAPIEDGDLAVLENVPQLRNLNLGLTRIGDATIDIIAGLRQLEVLHLGGTAISDDGIRKLAELPVLRDLVLWETKVSGAGLQALAGCGSLRYMDADQTSVKAEDLLAFRAQRPEVRLPADVWAETV